MIVVAGLSNDKDVEKISEIIRKKADKIVLTQAKSERAMDVSTARKYFANALIVKNSKKALEYAKKIANKEDLILAAGSIFMIGEIIP